MGIGERSLASGIGASGPPKKMFERSRTASRIRFVAMHCEKTGRNYLGLVDVGRTWL
jgi:hypothetical protein